MSEERAKGKTAGQGGGDRPRLEKGLVHVYTGDGKGKTTAALGLALRALGHGLRVYVIQFLKGNIDYGELEASRAFGDRFVVEQRGRETFVDPKNPDPVDVELARGALERSREVLASGEWDIVVLDEVSVAVAFGMIGPEEVLEAVEARAPHVEVVLTGRRAHPMFVEATDLVTEMRLVKHYYDRGVEARKGIEF